jgi:hypothetical protein
MSQITMRPPKAGMKVSMLGSSYAYARMPLGAADTATTWSYEDGNGNTVVVDKATDKVISTTDKSGKVLNAVGTGLNIIDDILSIFKPKPALTAEAPIPQKDNTALYVVGGAAALIALVMVMKK